MLFWGGLLLRIPGILHFVLTATFEGYSLSLPPEVILKFEPGLPSRSWSMPPKLDATEPSEVR